MTYATPEYERYCQLCVDNNWRFTWIRYGEWRRRQGEKPPEKEVKQGVFAFTQTEQGVIQ